MGHDFDCFGRLVFDDRVMKATLSGEVYQKLRRTIDEGSELEPAVADAVAAAAKRAFDPGLSCAYEAGRVERLCQLADAIDAQTRELEQLAAETGAIPSAALQAEAIRDRLRPAMVSLRAACDEAETVSPPAEWPFPAYSELLFSV